MPRQYGPSAQGYCGNKVQTTLEGTEEQLRTNAAHCNITSNRLKSSREEKLQYKKDHCNSSGNGNP